MGRDSALGDALDVKRPGDGEAAPLPVGNDLGSNPQGIGGCGLTATEVVEEAAIQVHAAILNAALPFSQQPVEPYTQDVHYSAEVEKEDDLKTIPIQPLLDRLEERNMRPADFARMLNISDQRLTNWKRRGIPRAELYTVTKAISMTVEEYIELATAPKPGKVAVGKRVRKVTAQEPASRYAMIPHYNVAGGLGAARINEHHIEIEADFPVPMSLIQRNGWRLDALQVIWTKGDSMEPNIRDGDPVVVNTDMKAIESGSVYAFVDADGGLSVKRLHRERDGRTRVASDNYNKLVYPDTFISIDDRVEIIGKVVHRSGAP